MSTPSSGQSSAVALAKRYWAPVLIIVLVVIFVVQNTQRVRMNYLWLGLSFPLWLLVTVMLLLGVVVGWFIGRRKD